MRVVTSKHQLTGLSHVGIRVGKLAPARAFYEKIGFRFVMGPIGNEPVAIMDHPSGLCLNLVINAVTSGDPNILMDVAEKHPGFTHVALFVEDLRLTEQFLIDEGIIITEGPVTFPDGTRALFRTRSARHAR
jgi:lactoylglutathione lyase